MYRIVKRIVHTITTVTWLVRLEDEAADGTPVERQITFPASHSFTEEDVSNESKSTKLITENPQPTLDEGEKP
jgi:hypothetical protein